MTTAVYLRVSSMMQADQNGVDAQRTAIRRWQAAHGVENAREYEDNGYSGKDFDRPAWQDLQRDIQAGKVTTVIVYSLDRIGRCCGQTISWFEHMRDLKVRVVVVKDGWDTDSPMAMLIISVMAAVAEWQRHDIRERCRSGIAARIARGEGWGADSWCR